MSPQDPGGQVLRFRDSLTQASRLWQVVRFSSLKRQVLHVMSKSVNVGISFPYSIVVAPTLRSYCKYFGPCVFQEALQSQRAFSFSKLPQVNKGSLLKFLPGNLLGATVIRAALGAEPVISGRRDGLRVPAYVHALRQCEVSCCYKVFLPECQCPVRCVTGSACCQEDAAGVFRTRFAPSKARA